MMRLAPVTRLLGWLVAIPTASADEMSDYGAYLSGECVTCHRSESADSRIPQLAGRSRQEILEALFAFKSGARVSPVMQDIAARLAEDEMRALAAYFSSIAVSRDCHEASPQEKHC